MNVQVESGVDNELPHMEETKETYTTGHAQLYVIGIVKVQGLLEEFH